MADAAVGFPLGITTVEVKAFEAEQAIKNGAGEIDYVINIGKMKQGEVWAQDADNLVSTDGMIMDEKGNLYIVDFCANAIVKIFPDGTVTKLCQNGDTDGFSEYFVSLPKWQQLAVLNRTQYKA